LGKDSRDLSDHTKSLFLKIQLFPIAKHDHMSLVRKELIESIKIKQCHDFFDYVTKDYLSSGNFIDLYSDSGRDNQVDMWSKGIFDNDITENSVSIPDSSGNKIAKHYRELLKCKSFTKDGLKEAAEFKDKFSLEGLITRVKTINLSEVDNVHTKAFKGWLEAKGLIEDFTKSEKFIRCQKEFGSSCLLTNVAPYTAYVYTITLLSGFNIFSNPTIQTKTNNLDSDWVDINYIFYFPFIDYFATKDKLFTSYLKEFQSFKDISLAKHKYVFMDIYNKLHAKFPSIINMDKPVLLAIAIIGEMLKEVSVPNAVLYKWIAWYFRKSNYYAIHEVGAMRYNLDGSEAYAITEKDQAKLDKRMGKAKGRQSQQKDSKETLSKKQDKNPAKNKSEDSATSPDVHSAK